MKFRRSAGIMLFQPTVFLFLSKTPDENCQKRPMKMLKIARWVLRDRKIFVSLRLKNRMILWNIYLESQTMN